MVSIEVNAASDKGDQEGCGDEPIYSSRDKDLNETRVLRTKRRAERHSGTRLMPRPRGRRAYDMHPKGPVSRALHTQRTHRPYSGLKGRE